MAFECVVRGYLSGSAWAEYRERGTLAGEPLPAGLLESGRLEPPIFSPATKAESGHDLNVTFGAVAAALGEELAGRLRDASFAVYRAGRDHAAARGIIIADTKFEFGTDAGGTLRLIDEVMTPDSSRFWPAARYQPGRSQPSFDKQPLRDYLAEIKRAGHWNGEAPPPPLPAEVVDGDERAVPRGVSPVHRAAAGGLGMIRTAPEGRWFIVGAWVDRAGAARGRGAERDAGVVGRRGGLDPARGLGRRLLPRSRAGLGPGRPPGRGPGRRQGGECRSRWTSRRSCTAARFGCRSS